MPIDTETILVDSHPVQVKFLACGAHADVYHGADDPSKVYALVTGCPMKEVLKGIKHPHIPYITQHAPFKAWDLFSMPRYNWVSTDTCWEIYREMSSAYHLAKRNIYQQDKDARTSTHGLLYSSETIKILKENKSIPESVIDGMSIIYDRMAPLGVDCTFDISAENVAEDDNGNIILLDIAFKWGA